MSNYYEYAPPIFRWILGNTNIKPWEMFPWFWGFFLLLSIVIIIFACIRFVRNKNKIINIMLLMIGAAGLCVTPFLNKLYLDYEWQKALDIPSYFIRKQVQADSYAFITLKSDKYYPAISLQIEPEQVKKIRFLKISEKEDGYGNIKFQINDDACLNHQLKPYQSIEKVDMSVRFDNGYHYSFLSYPLRYLSKNYNSEMVNGVYFKIKQNDQCFEGVRPQIQSRYYIIREDKYISVGLGLSRNKISIVDSQTGETIAYGYTFFKGKTYLAEWILSVTGFGADLKFSENHHFIPKTDSQVIEYRKYIPVYGNNAESITDRLIRYTLIPTYYYENPEGDVL